MWNLVHRIVLLWLVEVQNIQSTFGIQHNYSRLWYASGQMPDCETDREKRNRTAYYLICKQKIPFDMVWRSKMIRLVAVISTFKRVWKLFLDLKQSSTEDLEDIKVKTLQTFKVLVRFLFIPVSLKVLFVNGRVTLEEGMSAMKELLRLPNRVRR